MRAILSFITVIELAEAHFYFVQAPFTFVPAFSSASHGQVALFSHSRLWGVVTSHQHYIIVPVPGWH